MKQLLIMLIAMAWMTMMIVACQSEVDITSEEGTEQIPSNNDDVFGEEMTYWIDVRTPEEFAQGHVTGSINIPYEIIGQEISSITRDVDSDIRVYCRSGNRSGIAMNTLNGIGYANVINEGGYEDMMQRKAAGEDIP